MSIQPRKQRKMRYNAPIHRRRKMIASHLAEELMLKYNKRSVTVKKGDTVKIIRGGLKGLIGKVASVDTKKMKITVEGATAAKADKSQVARPIDPSNVIITHLDLSDPWRSKKIGEGKIKRKRKIKEKKEEIKKEKAEKGVEEKKGVKKEERTEELKEKAEEEEKKEKEEKKTEKEIEGKEKEEIEEELEKEGEKIEPESEIKESKKTELKEEVEEKEKSEKADKMEDVKKIKEEEEGLT